MESAAPLKELFADDDGDGGLKAIRESKITGYDPPVLSQAMGMDGITGEPSAKRQRVDSTLSNRSGGGAVGPPGSAAKATEMSVMDINDIHVAARKFGADNVHVRRYVLKFDGCEFQSELYKLL